MKKYFDFLTDALDGTDHKDQKPSFVRALFYPAVFVGIFFLVFSFQVLLSGDGVDHTKPKGQGALSFFNSIISSGDKDLKGEDEDRINILVTGMGGLGHSGPFLTDTMIVASIQPSTNKVSLLSLPRDLSVSIPGYGWRRINNVNHYGELKDPGKGAEFTADYVSQLLNLPIHYYVRIDFNGFKQMIDDLGGIDVYVEKAFTDTQFPDENFGFQTITFSQGWNEMNGNDALNYARSRHGSNGEASDFARSQRQQRVIKAVKDKLLSSSTFFSLKKMNSLLDTYKENVSTNLEVWEMIRFAKLAKQIENDNISNIVLDNSQGGLLYSTLINGAYLLVPRDESFFEIQQLALNMFDPNYVKEQKERATVEIMNGTKVNGLAYQASVDLTKKGFDVIKIGNAVTQDYEKTVIYDLTGGNKKTSLIQIKQLFTANVSNEIPEWLTTQTQPEEGKENTNPTATIDFLIVLGTEYASKTQ